MSLSRPTLAGLCVAAITGAALPVLLLWWLVWSQPALDPMEAQRRVTAGTAVLVDVRDDTAYARRHITGALRLADAPSNATRVLVCDDGLHSARATAMERDQGHDAVTLAGGLGGWIAAGSRPGARLAGLTVNGVPGPLPSREEPLAIQWLTVLTGFVVKPVYMLMALIAALLLRRIRSVPITALRRSLWCFFIGESFCAINYLVFADESLVTDHLHSTGMLLAVSFAAWAAYTGLHRHVLGADGQRCALSGWCRPCTRDAVCRIDRALPLAVGMLALLACIPLTVTPVPAWASLTSILGTPFAYHHEMAQQLIEVRWDPLFGLALLLVALTAWWRGHQTAAAAWCCAAAGPIVFALFRAGLVQMWRDDPAWFLAWEELSEWATLIAVWWWLPVLRRPAEPTP